MTVHVGLGQFFPKPAPPPRLPLVGGIDLSTASTGIALWSPPTDTTPAVKDLYRIRSTPECGKGETPTLAQRYTRNAKTAARILDIVGACDLVVIEASAASQTSNAGSIDMLGLWWKVVGGLLDKGIPVAEVMPSTRARYAVGYAEKKRPKGVPAPDASKDAVLAAVIKRFPEWDVKGNDVADALLCAGLGADWLGHPIVAMPANCRQALAAVHWPVTS